MTGFLVKKGKQTVDEALTSMRQTVDEALTSKHETVSGNMAEAGL